MTVCDIWTPDESNGIQQIVWGSVKYCKKGGPRMQTTTYGTDQTRQDFYYDDDHNAWLVQGNGGNYSRKGIMAGKRT